MSNRLEGSTITKTDAKAHWIYDAGGRTHYDAKISD